MEIARVLLQDIKTRIAEEEMVILKADDPAKKLNRRQRGLALVLVLWTARYLKDECQPSH